MFGTFYLEQEKNMASESPNEKSGLEHTAQAAHAAKGAVKAGKALAGASKGAALGPYGLAAGLAWEGRKFIVKAAIDFAALGCIRIHISIGESDSTGYVLICKLLNVTEPAEPVVPEVPAPDTVVPEIRAFVTWSRTYTVMEWRRTNRICCP